MTYLVVRTQRSSSDLIVGEQRSSTIGYPDRYIEPDGLVASLFGDATAWLQQTTVRPDGIDSAALGAADVTHWLQFANIEGLDAGLIGAASIGESPRTVAPPWFYATSVGYPFVGEYLTIGPVDGIAGLWGTATVASNLQRMYGYGLQAGPVGTHQVISDLRSLRPQGYSQTLFGRAEMVPLLRTLLHSYGVTAEDRGIGSPSLRMMTLWTDGIASGGASQRVDVMRSGQVINPAGLTAGGHGRTFVSWWERTLAAEPLDSFYSSSWHHARNDARVRSPLGFEAGTRGTPTVTNDLRFVQQVFPATGAIGAPWVADAVRSVTIIEGPPQPLWPAPLVQNWERFLQPAGYATPTTGKLYLEHRQNRIIPDRVLPHSKYGTASLVNEDRELRLSGPDAGPRGTPRVSRDPEYLIPTGNVHSLFALSLVRDSTQTVRVSFAGSGGFVPETHWMRKELPDPPFAQFLEATTCGNTSVVSEPILRTNYVYPDGVASTAFGSASVVVNGIRPNGIPPAGYGAGGPVGVPSLPGTQTVGPDGIYQHQFGSVDLTPHWIFAPAGIGRGAGQYIDQHLFGDDPSRPRFGAIEVSHDVRSMVGVGYVASLYGDAAVTNQHRTLPLTGARYFKPGYPIVGGASDINARGLLATDIGAATVSRPVVVGDQSVEPLGMTAAIGFLEVQNQHRQIAAGGDDHVLPGYLWISYQYEPFEIAAVYATEWGEALVQYLHRQIDAVGGTDMLDMTPFPGWSGDRMRVKSHTYIAPSGSVHTLSGTASVTQIDRVWGVNGIERPQFQVPEGLRLRGESVLEPAGLDAGTIGTPSKWQDGDDVQPYGEAMGAMGSTLLSFVVAGSGFDALLMGDIAITAPIEPSGQDATAFGLATAAHDGGGRICNSNYALAIALAAFDAGGIGSHEVAHD